MSDDKLNTEPGKVRLQDKRTEEELISIMNHLVNVCRVLPDDPLLLLIPKLVARLSGERDDMRDLLILAVSGLEMERKFREESTACIDAWQQDFLEAARNAVKS